MVGTFAFEAALLCASIAGVSHAAVAYQALVIFTGVSAALVLNNDEAIMIATIKLGKGRVPSYAYGILGALAVGTLIYQEAPVSAGLALLHYLSLSSLKAEADKRM